MNEECLSFLVENPKGDVLGVFTSLTAALGYMRQGAFCDISVYRLRVHDTNRGIGQ